MAAERIFDFLSQIAKNNNREFFAENKQLYLNAKSDMEQLVDSLIRSISVFDSSVSYLQPKDCIYRIYRDIRFSPDKSPYKRHFGAFIAPQGGHRSVLSGYYLHLEPGGHSVLAVGTYGLDKQQLAMMRDAIYGGYEEFMELVGKTEVKEAFGDVVSFSTTLKKCPNGYPADFEGVRYLKLKDYGLVANFTDEMVLSSDFADRVVSLCSLAAPFCRFVNSVLTQKD